MQHHGETMARRDGAIPERSPECAERANIHNMENKNFHHETTVFSRWLPKQESREKPTGKVGKWVSSSGIS